MGLIMNSTKRHILNTLRAQTTEHADTADGLHYDAVMSPDLPGTLSISTTRKYLNELSDEGLAIAESYGRSKLYRARGKQ
jgi:hypothetical protein